MGQIIENAVQMALGALPAVGRARARLRPGHTLTPALDGAYELGRGEARQGRSMDALLSAYRVGARVAWRELSATAVDAGLSAANVARFAELVFAFIDELSASSVAGHADELATTGRVRQRYLERLAQQLLAGEPAEILRASAERADWRPPDTLTAVVLPRTQTAGLAARFGQSTLQVSEDLPGVDAVGVAGRAAGPRSGRPASRPTAFGVAGPTGVGRARLGRGCWSSRRIVVRCGHAI